MLAGIELGIDAPHVAAQARFPGDLFLRLIRMIVAPLLFATITTGIAGHNELRTVGRIAIKALIYFEVVTTLGLIIGVVAMNSPERAGASQSPRTRRLRPPQPTPNLASDRPQPRPGEHRTGRRSKPDLQVAIFSILFGLPWPCCPSRSALRCWPAAVARRYHVSAHAHHHVSRAACSRCGNRLHSWQHRPAACCRLQSSL